jgi:hypothetical protein
VEGEVTAARKRKVGELDWTRTSVVKENLCHAMNIYT